MNAQLIKACKYCGGPDHAIGECHAVAAAEYRADGSIKRVEFQRPTLQSAPNALNWFDVRSGLGVPWAAAK